MSGAGPQALVFDLDGTLIDSAPDICAMANALLAEEGIDRVSLAEARGFVGAGADAFVRRMRAARGIPEADHARLLARFLELYEGAVAHSVIYPGVLDALTLFAGKGHALAVCTNKPIRPTHIVLDHFEMRGRFGAVIGGDTLPVRKPDPAPIHAAFAALGAETGLYVGDSEVDADAAARAGVPFLLFTEGYRKTPVAEMPHDAAFSHWDELPALIERLTVRVA